MKKTMLPSQEHLLAAIREETIILALDLVFLLGRSAVRGILAHLLPLWGPLSSRVGALCLCVGVLTLPLLCFSEEGDQVTLLQGLHGSQGGLTASMVSSERVLVCVFPPSRRL